MWGWGIRQRSKDRREGKHCNKNLQSSEGGAEGQETAGNVLVLSPPPQHSFLVLQSPLFIYLFWRLQTQPFWTQLPANWGFNFHITYTPPHNSLYFVKLNWLVLPLWNSIPIFFLCFSVLGLLSENIFCLLFTRQLCFMKGGNHPPSRAKYLEVEWCFPFLFTFQISSFPPNQMGTTNKTR